MEWFEFLCVSFLLYYIKSIKENNCWQSKRYHGCSFIAFATMVSRISSPCDLQNYNSCQSALSLLLGPNISKDHRVQRLLKGVFRLRPPLPKYNLTWDTTCVLDQLSQWYPNEELTLTQLTKKTITLLALTTAHRVQTLSKINIKNIH